MSELTRRDVVRGASLATALSYSRILGANDRVGMGYIGLGNQGAPIARKFYSEVGIKALPLYIDPSAKAAFTLDAAGLPASLLIDRAGREIGRHLGAVKWDDPEVLERLRRAITAE